MRAAVSLLMCSECIHSYTGVGSHCTVMMARVG